MHTTIENGLIVNDGKPAGFLFRFERGIYSPDGVQADFTDAQIAEHNRRLGELTVAQMQQTGRALLYATGCGEVGTWDGSQRWTIEHSRKSWHNMAGKDGRTDLWFCVDGARWHGVNIGDNQIVRARRVKR